MRDWREDQGVMRGGWLPSLLPVLRNFSGKGCKSLCPLSPARAGRPCHVRRNCDTGVPPVRATLVDQHLRSLPEKLRNSGRGSAHFVTPSARGSTHVCVGAGATDACGVAGPTG